MYEDVYRLCQNVEKIMGIFSEELRILDRNTVQYMMDEMQAEIDSQKAKLADKDVQLADKDAEIERLRRLINEIQE